MSIAAVLAPLFVEVALTFALLLWTAQLRRNDVYGKNVALSQIALGQPNWPARTMQVGNSFNNQFQLPVLFYVLTILVIITHHADILFVVLAWIFVLTRIAHAAVHTTNNIVLRRGAIYGVGAIVLIVMWIIFAVRILLGLG